MIQSKLSQALLVATLISPLLLNACASSRTKAPTVKTSSTQNSARPALESESIDKAMKTALAQAEASGNTQEALSILSQIHARNPNDAIVATRYARALREDEQMNKAVSVLRPYSDTKTPNVEALTEMAMTQLSLGDYEAAKLYSLKSTVIDPKNARGFLALGTAQDALKDHENAEISFRQGLKNWQGDPSPILNNMALNLASQGHLQSSLSLLERALKISPNRMELERNRRIIATLVETSGPEAPAPHKKPDIIIPPSAKPVVKAPAPVVQPVVAPQATQTSSVKPMPEPAKVTEKAKVKPKPVQITTEDINSMKVKTNIKLKSSVND